MCTVFVQRWMWDGNDTCFCCKDGQVNSLLKGKRKPHHGRLWVRKKWNEDEELEDINMD